MCEQLEATSRQQGAESEERVWGDIGTRTWLARMVAWTLNEPLQSSERRSSDSS